MIGNDIVDLNASRQESNWQRKGWIQKIFSVQEQTFIHLSTEQEKVIWLFWSMKEAAYKIFNRNSGKTFYAPNAFNCTISKITSNIAIGKVLHEDLSYNTETVFNANYIHTIAKADVIKDNNNLNNVIISNIDESVKLPTHLTLHKDRRGIPYLSDIKTGNSIDASLSHHGNYTALVY